LIQGHLSGASIVEVFVDGDDLNYRPADIEQPEDLLLIH
jgi:hypothetical protein